MALELALHALGIGPGDDVVVTCRSFVASAGCAVLLGARPVFADVDAVSQNVTAASIRAVLTPRTRAVIVVHLAGWPCDMDPILELARERSSRSRNCAQSHGATYKAREAIRRVALSRLPGQDISTGARRNALTNDRGSGKRRVYKDTARATMGFPAPAPAGFAGCTSHLHNWRMTEMQGAIAADR